MARRKSRVLTELELEIMRVVWNSGEATVEEIQRALQEHGRPLAPPSVRTMLAILQEKGYVRRRAVGRGFVYGAAVSRKRARHSIVRDVIERAFEGSALDLVASLIKTRMVSKVDLDRVKQMIREHEKEGKK